MRVSVWCKYQVVAKQPDSAVRLACLHKVVPRKCASFVCFHHASPALRESISQPKLGSIQKQDVRSDDFVSDRSADSITDGNDDHESTIYRKSNLKNTYSCSGSVSSNDNVDDALGDTTQEQFFTFSEGKRVHWTDASGKDLVQIREFEPSEPDEDCEDKNAHRCSCVIM